MQLTPVQLKGNIATVRMQFTCNSQAYHSNSLFTLSSPSQVLKLGSKYHFILKTMMDTCVN